MRSLKLEGEGRCRLVEVPDPVPGPGQVVIRTTASALCGSELKPYRGAGVAAGNSGHEAMGRVEALGDGVEGLRLGDRVGVSAIAGCGQPDCDACRQGQSTWCPHFRFTGGMHAERFVTWATGCLPLPADVPDDAGVLVSGDGFGVPYHTSRKLTSPEVRRVAVFGLGPIGLGQVLLQSYLGREVMAIDVNPDRLGLAERLGAAVRIAAREQDPVAAVRAATGGRGADVAIEAAGVPETARQCFRAVRTGGMVVFNGEQPAVELSPSDDFIRRDVQAVGAWFFQVGEFTEMVRLYRAGCDVTRLITHRYAFEDAPEAFAAFAAGRTGKVLLTYGG